MHPATAPHRKATMTLTSPTLTRAAEAIVTALIAAGFTLQTSVHPSAGARTLWAVGPTGMSGPFAVFRVGARSGRITAVPELRLHGEDGPIEKLTGEAGAIAATSRLVAAADAHTTTADATDWQPEPGSLVEYIGSAVDQRGRWNVVGVIKHGPYAGRTLLQHPTDTRRQLTPSAGNRSLRPVA